MTDQDQIRQELISLAEPAYQHFTASLLPGCSNLLGVRLPLLRKLAVRLSRDKSFDIPAYLRHTDELYFEETMLKGMLIDCLPDDIGLILAQVRYFLPKITNWSLCDTFCGGLKKAVQHHRREVWDFLGPYWQAEQPYELRFAIVMSLRFFIDAEHLHQLFNYYNSIDHDDYYVKMAVAWAVSMCFVHFPAATLAFLQENQLDTATRSKALQKICESRQVSPADKDTIRLLKKTRT